MQSFCTDLSGVRRNCRNSCATKDTDKFPLNSAIETSPHLEPPSKHTPNIAQLSHTQKKSPPKSADFSETRSSSTVACFDRLQVSKTCKNMSSIAWRYSGWLLGCETTSATTFYAAVVCKAQVTEMAQQHAVSIFVRKVFFTSCLLMDLEV